jgi:hypothetical protein
VVTRASRSGDRRAGQEDEILARGEIAVEEQVVAQDADLAAQIAAEHARRRVAVADLADVGRTSVDSTPSSVDLPAPFGPNKPVTAPCWNVRDVLASARRRP